MERGHSKTRCTTIAMTDDLKFLPAQLISKFKKRVGQRGHVGAGRTALGDTVTRVMNNCKLIGIQVKVLKKAVVYGRTKPAMDDHDLLGALSNPLSNLSIHEDSSFAKDTNQTIRIGTIQTQKALMSAMPIPSQHGGNKVTPPSSAYRRWN